MLEDEVAEITNMSATDIWLKDLGVLESAWNEFLKSGKVSGNDHQQLHKIDEADGGGSARFHSLSQRKRFTTLRKF